eukprot:3421363-Pyramimonas_sp.AAC.1
MRLAHRPGVLYTWGEHCRVVLASPKVFQVVVRVCVCVCARAARVSGTPCLGGGALHVHFCRLFDQATSRFDLGFSRLQVDGAGVSQPA